MTTNRSERRRQLATLRKAKAASQRADTVALLSPTHENLTRAFALRAVVKLGEARLEVLPE